MVCKSSARYCEGGDAAAQRPYQSISIDSFRVNADAMQVPGKSFNHEKVELPGIQTSSARSWVVDGCAVYVGRVFAVG